MAKSEVAYLLRQSELEYEAAERGLKGLAAGWARHDFINRRYEERGRHHKEPARLAGTEEATRLVYQLPPGREQQAQTPAAAPTTLTPSEYAQAECDAPPPDSGAAASVS